MRHLSLQKRLVGLCLLLGILPALVLTCVNYGTLGGLSKNSAERLHGFAVGFADTIDRSLFERYGDVQAFGYNQVIFDTASWYKTGSRANKIAQRMNNYVQAYGLYDLTLLVDLTGKVVAVNDIDAEGRQIETESIYSLSFADAQWFKDALEGKFYTAPGALSGTVLEPFYVDPLVKKVYGNEGLTIGFSAPVKDQNDKIIGVWKNFAKFSLVEDILQSAYSSLKAQGLRTTSLTLLDSQGTALSVYDPRRWTTSRYVRDMSLIGAYNFTKRDYSPAQQATSQREGAELAVNPLSGVSEFSGYTYFKGAMGFKGMPWSLLVNASEDELLADIRATKRNILVFLALCIGFILSASGYVARRLAQPFLAAIRVLQASCEHIEGVSRETVRGGESLSSGSRQQAAAIQQSVSALAEMSSMIGQTTEHSHAAEAEAVEMACVTEAGSRTMEKMVTSMEAIHQANSQLQEMANIIQQISAKTTVINDIVFKTQLLSFNASIEAARAGQHGRGFAVVAEEVGNLAEMSGTAAKEIQALLDSSTKQVNQIVSVTQARVNEGQAVSKDSLTIFNNLASKIQAVTRQVGSILEASREQSEGVNQATTAMSELDRLAQDNQSLAHQGAKSAGTLEAEVSRLREGVALLTRVVFGRSTGADRTGPGVEVRRNITTPTVTRQSRPRASAPRKISQPRRVEAPAPGVISADDESFRPIH